MEVGNGLKPFPTMSDHEGKLNNINDGLGF